MFRDFEILEVRSSCVLGFGGYISGVGGFLYLSREYLMVLLRVLVVFKLLAKEGIVFFIGYWWVLVMGIWVLGSYNYSRRGN